MTSFDRDLTRALYEVAFAALDLPQPEAMSELSNEEIETHIDRELQFDSDLVA
ncbi:hypothetical protein [Marinobacter salicampi]|uniref:hypothetical protein n=1 Tax=Marinobacter salicampi TaxID=435907 RepID=UPI00140CEFC2|nr:hypothetical protein [Marinobacter salicampi]